MNFPKGTRIRVDLAGTVGQKRDENPFGTTDVRNTNGMPWTHLLYLNSRAVTGNKALGGEIRARFDAVVTGGYKEGGRVTTEVRELDVRDETGGYFHFLYLDDNKAVTVINNNNNNKDKEMPYSSGEAVLVEFTGRVRSTEGPNSTTQVSEIENGYVHYLFLDDRSVFPGGIPAEGDTVEISFTAVIQDDNSIRDSCREVRSKENEFTHFVYLGSESVTKASSSGTAGNEKAEDKGVAYNAGDIIKVEFTGRIGTKTKEMPAGTTQVKQINPEGYVHFLYLGDTDIFPTVNYGQSRPREGDEVKVSFTAVVRPAGKGGPAFTREVSRSGFTHYVFLGSGEVTKKLSISNIADGVLTNPAFATAGVLGNKPVFATDEKITSAGVNERISFLEATKTEYGFYTITRDRTGTLLTGFDEKPLKFSATSAASAYLDEEDLEPLRFTINRDDRGGLTADEVSELIQLKDLAQRGRVIYGASSWDSGKIVLRPESYFDEQWARKQTTEKFALDEGAVYTWPFDYTDWQEAAQDLRNIRYLSIPFAGVRFWGRYVTP